MRTDRGTKRQSIQPESTSDDSDDSGRIFSAQHHKRLRRSAIIPKASDDQSVGCGDSDDKDDVKSGGSDIDRRDRRIPEKRFLVLTAAGTACDPELLPSLETSSDVRDEVLDPEDQGQSTSTRSEQQVDEDSMAHRSDQPIEEGDELETSLEDSKESSWPEDEDNSGSLPPEPEEASDSNFDLDSESEAASTDTSESKLLTQTSRRKFFRRSPVPRIKRRGSSAEDHYHKRWHSGKPSREAQQNIVEKLRSFFWEGGSGNGGRLPRCFSCRMSGVTPPSTLIGDRLEERLPCGCLYKEAMLEMYLAKRGVLTKQQKQRQDRLDQHHRRDLINMFELFFGPFTVEKMLNLGGARLKAAEEAALQDDMLADRLSSTRL